MPVDRYDAASFAPVIAGRSRPARLASEKAAVAEICARVAAEGDSALRELGLRFDGWAPGDGETFEVPKAELARAADRMDPADRAALELAARRIHDFHSRQLESEFRGSGGLNI